MGLDKWAGQASGFPSAGYEKQVLYPWAAILNNVEPKATPTWSDYSEVATGANIFDLVGNAINAGSPYENVTAYNPDQLIRDIKDALDDLKSEIDDYDEETLNDAVRQASEQVDALMGTSNIADLVELYRTRMDTAYNRDVSALYAGLWEAGAIVGTQTFAAAAMMKNERSKQVSEYELQLEVNRQSARMSLVGDLLNKAFNISVQKMQMRQMQLGAEFDRLKFVVTTKQDQQDKDLEYLTKHLTYDLDLLQYATNGLGAIYGAQQVPRQQTKGERLLAALSSSVSMGIQGGMALGSPGAGVGLGAFNLFSQLLLTPR
jgi:hypothetical protein